MFSKLNKINIENSTNQQHQSDIIFNKQINNNCDQDDLDNDQNDDFQDDDNNCNQKLLLLNNNNNNEDNKLISIKTDGNYLKIYSPDNNHNEDDFNEYNINDNDHDNDNNDHFNNINDDNNRNLLKNNDHNNILIKYPCNCTNVNFVNNSIKTTINDNDRDNNRNNNNNNNNVNINNNNSNNNNNNNNYADIIDKNKNIIIARPKQLKIIKNLNDMIYNDNHINITIDHNNDDDNDNDKHKKQDADEIVGGTIQTPIINTNTGVDVNGDHNNDDNDEDNDDDDDHDGVVRGNFRGGSDSGNGGGDRVDRGRGRGGGGDRGDRGDNNNEQITELLSDDPVDCKAILNQNEDDEMTITGYRRSKSRTAICYIFFILTGGLLRLIMHWWPHWLLLATHTPCPLNKAEKLLIEENYQGKHTLYYVKDVVTLNAENLKKMNMDKDKWTNYISLESDFNDKGHFGLSIHFASGIFKKMDEIKMFRCKQLRYVWDDDLHQFVKLSGLDVDIQTVYLHQQKGLSEHEQYMRRLIYGTNEINIPIKTVMTLLFLEVLNPFYVFQVFSVCLWFSYNYYYYAIMIILMTAFGITMSIKQTRKNQLALYRTVTNCDEAFVLRDNGELCNINTKYLVPGDLLEIPSNGCTMQCDAILLSGNCILDESMLTGESVPVTKTPLPCKRDQLLDTKEHARHMLYCGTKIIQTRYIGSEKVLAVIINTGNKTAKGGLIRSILYPPPVDYKFEKDSYKFIGILGVIAVVGFFYTLSTKIQRGMSAAKIAIESLDLITIAVPPALPAAMAVGRMYAQKRLKQDRIYCISPRSINVSGSIDCVCFDKTGTLTEDGLDMWGVVPKSLTNSFQMPLRQLERLPFDNLLFGMVTCHSITLMNGDLKGDPLDLKMFESTGWILEEANISDDTKYDLLFPTIVRPPKRINLSADLNDDLIMPADTEIGIVREFSFTSSLQRMSVITRKLADQHFKVYCKGSPEMIITLCNPSTIPDDFHTCLDKYAQQGYRIIAVAYKPLDKKLSYAKVQRISRDKVETDLEFQGFVILENRLKQDTTKVISQLMKANIRTIMVTGDNILTALSVAKDCGMVTHRQSVITVNVRPSKQHTSGWELYYNLTCPAGRPVLALSSASGLTAGMPEPTQNGFSPEYHLMTNSNSIASFETIDTFTQTTNLSHRDVELGISKSEIKMAPDLPSNNYRFAMIGKTWAIIKDYYPEMLPRFVTRGTVFARMSPDQKQALVLELQGIGYYVAMCGDGANDCGALKAAHTGISLSEAESSVASPFTSKNPTIACVPNVIKEGRAALVTSFGIFKYMAAYSVVQFASVIILYSIDSNLTDTEFLYIDLFLISIFAFFFGQTKSYDGPLVKQTPLSSLVSLSPIASLLLQLIVAISFQAVGWYHLQSQPWFTPFNFTEKNPNAGDINLGCQENYTIFAISCFQYIILAFVFSKGAPYRKAIYTNKGFLISLMLTLVLSLYLVIAGVGPHVGFLELDVPPDLEFRLTIVFCAIINFIIAFIIEEFVIEYLLFKKIRYRFHNIEKSRRKFLATENYLRLNPAWPSLSCYPNDVQAPTPNTEAASPNSYAEIGVEHDIGSPFDQNSSVLNSFFEAPDDDIDVVVSDDEDDDDYNDDVIEYPVARRNSILQSRNDSGIGFEPHQHQSHQINNNNGQPLSEIILMPQSFQQYKPNYHHQLQRAHEHQQQQLSLLQPNRIIPNKAAAAAAAAASVSTKCVKNDEQSDGTLPLIEKIQLNYLENDNGKKIGRDNVTEFSNIVIVEPKQNNPSCLDQKTNTTTRS